MSYKPTVTLDFDGTIHSYSSGWKGEDIIPDPPVLGMPEAIENIRKEYKVIIVSTRSATTKGSNAIKAWLEKYNIEVDGVMSNKPPALVQIDDRVITFDGNPNTLLTKIKAFKPWYQQGE